MARHWGSWLARACVVGALVAAGAVAPHAAGAQEHGSGGDMGGMDGMVPVGPGGDGMIPTGDWSDQQRVQMLDLIHRTEQELPAFADAQHDLDIGFYDFGAEASGGWVHYINWAWMGDSHVLDPTHPESLVFHREQDGHLKLVSAMFFATIGTTMDTIPENIAWYPGWHTHHDVCIRDDDHKFGGLPPCPAGSQPFDKPPMMHVWIDKDGPCQHRFGGIDIDGVHCDVMGMPAGMGDTTTTTMPMGESTTTTSTTTMGTGTPPPPPATPIVEPPPTTG
jgi:hypothetical protein